MLAAATLAFTIFGEAHAQTYITDTATFTGLGDAIGSSFDQVVLNSVAGIFSGPGTYLVNTVDFTVGINSNDSHVNAGTFTNTGTVDGKPFSYSVPYTIAISYADTITIGGNSVIYNGYNIHFNTLSFTSGGGTVSGDLTATVTSVPELATWGMMVAGFGAIGYATRRRARVRTIVSFA